jgi:hypothetical protein
MQLLLTTKRHFTIALWMPVRLSATTPASLAACGGPWWDVSRRTLNLMEDILRTCYKCTLSAITHKLNVSGLMIWTFVLVLVCGTRAQSFSAPFSYTLYNLDTVIGLKWPTKGQCNSITQDCSPVQENHKPDRHRLLRKQQQVCNSQL